MKRCRDVRERGGVSGKGGEKGNFSGMKQNLNSINAIWFKSTRQKARSSDEEELTIKGEGALTKNREGKKKRAGLGKKRGE